MTTTNKKEVEIKKVITNETLSKSKKMIELYKLGIEIKEIANLMNVRYNFVYNVVSNFCNVNQVKLTTTKKEGKKEKIVELYKLGKSNKEISIELQTNYNYVYNTVKEYKNENPVTNETEAK